MTQSNLNQNPVTNRQVSQIVKGQRVSDGDGVRLTRVMGLQELNMLDPFLLFDAFQTDNPTDYIGGFPPHPHRGFETVTYLLAGRMRHKDSAGNEGVIEPGGVQWMTAGKGIIHSEMPEQKDGLLHGFQLWVNLPAEHKMTQPAYQEHSAEQVPTEQRGNDATVHVVSGTTSQGTTGPIENQYIHPVYFDVELHNDSLFTETLNEAHNAFVYVIEGSIDINGQIVEASSLAVLSEGEQLQLKSTSDYARLLLIAGQPINESVARGGPFVMNTREEIQQAFNDYEAGVLA